MANTADHRAIVDALLRVHGRTFAEEAGIELQADDADSIFCLLVTSLLLSARIDHRIAVAAARALFDRGWTSARALRDAGWQARTSVLNAAGYARYDESTSRMLGDTCEIALDRYDGDVRRLRADADGQVEVLAKALQAFKGIGKVGANIFLREVQAVWTEFSPFVDDRAGAAAKECHLPSDADSLSGLAGDDIARLTAALIRASIEGDVDRVLAIADGDEPAPVDPRRTTKADLYERASALDIPGRSKMRKDELAAAIEQTQERGAQG